jgi:hypothetical protein
VGPRAGLDSYEKSHTARPLGFETRTDQPAAIRYTDYTIPTTTVMNTASQNGNCKQGHRLQKLCYRRQHVLNITKKKKITEIQVVVMDMEIRQHTKTTNILVEICAMNVLTKGPEGHTATSPVTRTC